MGLAIGASLFSFLEIGFFLFQLMKITVRACTTTNCELAEERGGKRPRRKGVPPVVKRSIKPPANGVPVRRLKACGVAG